MSPQSRGRKKKPHGRGVAKPRELNPLVAVLKQFGAVAAGGDLFAIEDFVSGMLGAFYQPLAPAELPDPVLALLDHVDRQATAPALGLARTIAYLGCTDEQRAAAAAVADGIAERSRLEPMWTRRLAELSCVEAWRLGDVYGDQATVACVFERGGDRHAMFALMDFNHLGGWVKDLAITDDVDALLQDLREAVPDSGGIARLEQLAPERARQLVEDGIGASDLTLDAEVGEDYARYRALALARCRAMPGPSPAPVVPEHSDAERAAIVERFLAACADQLPPPEVARYPAQLFVDYGCDYDAGRPLRIGPGKLETFLLGYLPRKVILDPDDRAMLPDVARVWCDWAAERSQLPPAAVDELRDAVEVILDDFDDAYDDSGNASPIRAMVADLAGSGSVAEVEEALERRMFAMPYFGTTIGEDDYPRLDPSDPDERHLLIVGEHPEFHEAFTEPGFDGEIDGVNPRLHIAVDEIVVSQLWDGDPPEAWQAAQRLRDSGMERWDVLHRIGALVTEHIWNVMADDEPVDASRYVAALRSLRPDRPKRPGNRKAGPTSGVYRIKVTLRGSRPAIWRRLQVPATATLADLHEVIQAAFGWEHEHLHVFEADGKLYGPRGPGISDTLPTDRARLSSVLRAVGAELQYEYDMGDSWVHDVVVEQILPPDGVGHAVCVTGRRAAPVEDCGGIDGWEHLCRVLSDPSHPDYEEQFEWLGYQPDPAAFDLDAVNRMLERVVMR